MSSTIKLQPPTPLAPYLKNDSGAIQHDRALQLMYEALIELQAKYDALKARVEVLEA